MSYQIFRRYCRMASCFCSGDGQVGRRLAIRICGKWVPRSRPEVSFIPALAPARQGVGMRKILLWGWLGSGGLVADEHRIRERFADPATRTAALSELTSATREAYFYTALDHQLAGRQEAFAGTIAAWKSASAAEGNVVSDEGFEVLEKRKLLMDHEREPEAAVAALPTTLDPAGVSDEAFQVLASERLSGRKFRVRPPGVPRDQ